MNEFWVCAAVALGWGIGGVSGGATGLGAIMIAMPILTLVLTIQEAVLVSCIIGLFGAFQMVAVYYRHCVWKDLREMAVGAVPGCLVGSLALAAVPLRILQLMVCVMLACFIGMQLFRRAAAYTLPESCSLNILAGLISGFVNASVAMVGAPLGIYVLLRHWPPDKAKGTMSVFYLFAALLSVAGQAAGGLYTGRLLFLSLFGIAGCFAGTVVGIRLSRHIDQQLFQKLVLFFLAVCAILLFVKAVC